MPEAEIDGMDGTGYFEFIDKNMATAPLMACFIQERIAIHPGQKVVIVSGYAENQRVNKARELGAGVYVRKP